MVKLYHPHVSNPYRKILIGIEVSKCQTVSHVSNPYRKILIQ